MLGIKGSTVTVQLAIAGKMRYGVELAARVSIRDNVDEYLSTL